MATANGEFRTAALTELKESKHNPRRTVSKAGLAELADSIRAKGVLMPLLTRPHPKAKGKLEVLGGSRRLKAAKAAGLTEVPVRVVELDDAAALEVIIIDNLQRQDVHPLEEADGYRVLANQHGLTEAQIAQRVSKSPAFVARRLALTTLVPAARQALDAGQIRIGHAELLATIAPEQQERLLGDMVPQWARDGELTDWSISTLREEIRIHVFRVLADAPFDPEDANLVVAAGPCSACPKRSGARPALFDGIVKGDACPDDPCWQTKVAATIANREAAEAAKHGAIVRLSGDYAYGKQKKGAPLPANTWREVPAKEAKTNRRAKRGLVVDGKKAGHAVWFVPDRGSPYRREETPRGRQRRQTAERKRRAKAEADAAAVKAALGHVLTKVSGRPLGRRELRLVAESFFLRHWHDAREAVRARMGWDKRQVATRPKVRAAIGKLTDAQLRSFLVDCALAGGLVDHTRAASVQEAAKLLGIKVGPAMQKARAAHRKRERELEQQWAAKKKAAKKAAKSVKAKKGKKGRKKAGKPRRKAAKRA